MMAKSRRPKLKQQSTKPAATRANSQHTAVASSNQPSRRSPFWLIIIGLPVVIILIAGLWPLSTTTPRRSNKYIKPATESLEALGPAQLESILKLPEHEPVAELTVFDTETWSARLAAALGQLNEQLKDDAQVAHLTGLINLRLKRSQLAEPALLRAVQLAPNNQEMRSDLAEQLMQVGRDDEALIVLQSLPSSELMSANYATKLADCQLRLGLLEEANQVLTSALQKNPRSSTLWLLLGKTQLQLERYADSEASVRQALASDQSSVEAWLVLEQALNLQQRREEAKSATAKASELKRAQPPVEPFERAHAQEMSKVYGSAFRSMALLYQTKGDTTKANSMFAAAMEADPRDWVALGKWAALFRKLGEFEHSAALHRRLLRADPQEAAHYQNLANLSMELGRPREAEAALRLACCVMPENGQCHLLLARFLLLLNKHQEAEKPALRAVDLLKNEEASEILRLVRGS